MSREDSAIQPATTQASTSLKSLATTASMFAANARIVGDQVHVTSPQISNPKFVRYLFRKPEPDPAISLVNSAGLPASSFMTDEFKPPREPIIQEAPKRELTEAELSRRRAGRQAKRAAQQTSSGKSSPAAPMTAEDVGSITESNGLAPEVTDLSSDDISFAKEQHLADLKRPFHRHCSGGYGGRDRGR